MFNDTLCEWFCEKFEKRTYIYIRSIPNLTRWFWYQQNLCSTNTKILSIFLRRMIRRDAEKFVITFCLVNET